MFVRDPSYPLLSFRDINVRDPPYSLLRAIDVCQGSILSMVVGHKCLSGIHPIHG